MEDAKSTIEDEANRIRLAAKRVCDHDGAPAQVTMLAFVVLAVLLVVRVLLERMPRRGELFR